MATGSKSKVQITLSLLFLNIMFFSVVNAGDAEKDISEYGAYYEYIINDRAVSGWGFTEIGKVKIMVINPRGDDYSYISLSENKYDKLKSVEILAYDKEGKEILKKNKKDMTKYCGFGEYAGYKDICYYTFDVDVPGYPYTIEYEYKKESSSLFSLRGGIYFQHKIPVNHFKYSVSIPGNGFISYKTYGLELEPIAGRDPSGTFAYIWEKRDIPAYDDLDYIPAGYGPGGRVAISPNRFKLEKYEFSGTDWRSIGQWYYELSWDKYSFSSSPSAKQIDSNRKEIIKNIYEEITRDIRYVLISIGIGGWQPHEAASVEKNAYGDCKDMSTLLISRLREVGIEAYPALVLTRNKGVTDVDFPNFGFNHVITVAIVGNDTLWMDPTCRLCPFGELPYQDEGINALVATNNGGELWRTSVSLAEKNTTTRMMRINIEKDLTATIITNISIVGAYARYLRGNILRYDADETRRFINNMFPGAEKRFRVKSYEFKNLEDISKPLEIIIKARTAKKLDKIGKKIYCPSLIFGQLSGFEKVDMEDREYPINLFYPDMEKDSIIITWDKVFDLESISTPPSDNVSFSFGGYRLNSESGDSLVAVNFEKSCEAYMIKIDEFTDYAFYIDKLKNIYKQYVKLKLK
ncbi:MAG: DUF3857 domain-containing protein [candidate division Zixibacteria bacterium]